MIHTYIQKLASTVSQEAMYNSHLILLVSCAAGTEFYISRDFYRVSLIQKVKKKREKKQEQAAPRKQASCIYLQATNNSTFV